MDWRSRLDDAGVLGGEGQRRLRWFGGWRGFFGSLVGLVTFGGGDQQSWMCRISGLGELAVEAGADPIGVDSGTDLRNWRHCCRLFINIDILCTWNTA